MGDVHTNKESTYTFYNGIVYCWYDLLLMHQDVWIVFFAYCQYKRSPYLPWLQQMTNIVHHWQLVLQTHH